MDNKAQNDSLPVKILKTIIKNLVILFPTIVMAFLTLCMAGGIFAPPLLFFPEYIEKLAELLNAKTGAEL
ncbi:MULTISPECIES: hypothetical protein [Dehalococcoides]|uniref:Uncharacterized protein n=2 Tax=Dehalococcoidaceae TaxID=1202464 RepID=A0AB38Z883_9CHLR|nr:hypothetical protein [Dehalococcoides mccartyi]WRO06788.1 hypothetical protein VLL09_05215 [Dehalococcoides mccartyi]